MSRSAYGALGTLLCLAAAPAAFAEPVTLKANDGSVEIVGDLLAFEDGFYQIRTSLGDMRISAARMSCEGADCPVIDVAGADVTVTGSGVVGRGLMPLLITGFAEFQGGEAESEIGNDAEQVIFKLTADGGFGDPLGSYLVTSHTSSLGFSALTTKEADVAIASRRIHPDEARALRDSGAGNMVDPSQEHVIAVDSLIIVVHSTNPINEITLDDLAKVYLGEITNWSALGGTDAPINVYSRDEDSGTWEFFNEHIIKDRVPAGVSWTIAETEEDMARAVNEDPSSIGIVGHAFQRGAKALSIISDCGIRSAPDAFSAKTEDYPLERRIYLYNRADTTTEEITKLLEFAVSEAADTVVAKSGFIDLGVARLAQDSTEGRMRDIIQNTNDPYELTLMRDLLVEMLQWDRLSSTFRFGTGSTELDAKAQLDMIRLVNYLENLPAGTQIATVGFTDDEGAFDANRNLSLTRANQVVASIAEYAGSRLDHIEFSAKGFGELSPAACNSTPDGKRVNRRVEVWVRG